MSYTISIISQTFLINKQETTLTWIPLADESELNNFSPLTQAYGICYNDDHEAVILDQKGRGTWTLPGGTIESGESPAETLIREVMEEADISIDNICLLGVQKVEVVGKPVHYQTRYVAHIREVLPQTIDPALNRIHVRKFVPIEKMNEYLQWGRTGEAIVKKAVEVAS